MAISVGITARKFQAHGARDLDRIPHLRRLRPAERLTIRAIAAVLPFRVNNYVLDELIDWSAIPDDPIFQLTFPQRGMLDPLELQRMIDLVRKEGDGSPAVKAAATEIRRALNPHPAGQIELNVPREGGAPLPGMQHKYRETVLFFPAQGQTCHAYCTYCFRWAQFIGDVDLRFASREADTLVRYLRAHKEVRSVLFTGGDPMVMKTAVLRRYIEPLLGPGLEHITSVRIGTKAPAYWPHRFVTDDDADDLLRLFEEVRAAGKSLALMAHFSHPRELSTPIAAAAIARIQGAGAVIRCQAPLVRHVNDDPAVWSTMWQRQVQLGAVPYYMFVERDTGPRSYFEVPLARAHRIFRAAFAELSGLGRTVRGPSMSATPGKVCIDGVTEVGGEEVFALRFLQARDPAWVGRPFFARFDPEATWFDQLRPAFGAPRFFFEEGKRARLSPPIRAPEDAAHEVS